MTVDEAWDGIEDWLRAHAPGSHSGLPLPAAPGKIQAAQDTTGCAFPAELAASLARHDGSGEFLLPPLHRLHGTRLIVAEYRAYRRAERERSPGEHTWWDARWIPLADDGCGNSLFLSQAPGPSFGRIGDHAKDGGGSFSEDGASASLGAFLESTAQGLHDGHWGEYEPYVDDDGFLDWREPDADIVVAWDMQEMNRRYGFG
ncbi:SMI1/KNR4 family protein [Streptomyces rubiginosohelvolus]|uniref:SMI1/KNR4 family protein n=1 Tax=Streptomyces rubiginosohelvolus TaxID=67362 RepID=UPI0037F1E52E